MKIFTWRMTCNLTQQTLQYQISASDEKNMTEEPFLLTFTCLIYPLKLYLVY